MAEPGIFLYQDKFGKTQPRELFFNWKITGAVTVVSLPVAVASVAYVTFGAIAAQSTIDNFLGTTAEFNYLAFDATSMGTDAMGIIINMAGQAKRLDAFSIAAYSGSGFATVYQAGAWNNGITNTTLETACALGANGNIAVKVDFHQSGSFDSLTSGNIQLRVLWSAA